MPKPRRPSPFTRTLWKALLHVDHVIPLCKGGTDDMANLVTACCSCNLTKARNVWEPIPLPWGS